MHERVTPGTGKTHWVGLGIAVVAAAASVLWIGRPPATPPTPTPDQRDAQLELLLKTDPDAARVLLSQKQAATREAQRQRVLEIRALVAGRQIDKARAEAAAYYETWPDGPDVAELERLTGVHPKPR